MSKRPLHIQLLVLISVLIACSQEKKTDWQVSFDKNSKEPFGCYIAYHFLHAFFPSNTIESARNPFTEINRSLQNKYMLSRKHRFSIVVCRNFQTDSAELDKMIRYVSNGNTLCIMAENYSENMFTYFHLKYDNAYASLTTSAYKDNATISGQHNTLFFNHKQYVFRYDGLPIEYGFTKDSNFKEPFYYMGFSRNIDTPNRLIHFFGDGMLMICRNPISLTNHFLLQNENINYLNYFFSFFYAYPTSVTWYNMYERQMRDNSENDLSWLLHFPPLFYAFLLLALLMLFYTLFEGKRRQRIIPIHADNINTSLEFIETVGMLYYNKKDHKNLSDKMILHYLETIRSKYLLKTNELNDDFTLLLSQKINQPFTETNAHIAYIRYIRDSDSITVTDIRHLYYQLQKFI